MAYIVNNNINIFEPLMLNMFVTANDDFVVIKIGLSNCA